MQSDQVSNENAFNNCFVEPESPELFFLSIFTPQVYNLTFAVKQFKMTIKLLKYINKNMEVSFYGRQIW